MIRHPFLPCFQAVLPKPSLFLRLFLTFYLMTISKTAFAEELLQVSAAIHISSTVSDGKHSIAEIVRIARENKMRVVVITDRDFMRWEYGLWPLRGVIKKAVTSNSVGEYGVRRYLKDIEKAQKDNPDMLIIAAVESAPFYYWQGSPLKKNLKLKNWHKHMLVVGLENELDYQNLPTVSNLRKSSWPARYDQYHGDQADRPYQNLIDYVNSRGGLIFWAHPEAENVGTRGAIGIETKPYPDALLKTYGYTGFSVFYEGYTTIGSPGGIWDTTLKEYCQGKRKQPVWAIGGLCFDQVGELTEIMKDLRVIVLISDWSKKAVLKALKEGRDYVVLGKGGLRLESFEVTDSLKQNKPAMMGEEIALSANPRIKIKGYCLEEADVKIKIKLIRGGEIIKVFEAASPFEIEYQDEAVIAANKTYYRLEITSPGGMLVTNPIFLINEKVIQ
ncbi:MAG: hypothetical protein A2Y00_07425 [Omnitrophica WOR_2 bacterium GWF2_43_52]|nr:MAG: hypothetical protein A2Y01_01105 [Omnitrophica WOR_2 bacterium GWC2_44_8]OGX20250.1 MAG: hypothetical protein A2Y00_07425 [Omnitrophica WOR_2 bacterium GWF2_43_52]HAH20730.1 hypothetical protein [Candidatus Omnitrophota bacterium]HBG63598.1 hypothetical protein [Candidatus Omnitrophota bacterium]HCD37594.1 hypothetical protein [Candidatus Omnitrophota bacterium]